MNFLALLGWSPGSDEEIFTREDLVARFSLDGISGGNAVFNPDKLDWFNAQHLARLAPADLVARIRPELESAGLWDESLTGARREWFGRVLALLVPRAKRLGDFAPQLVPFLGTVDNYDPAAVDRHLKSPDLARPISALADTLRVLEPFDEASTEAAVRAQADAAGLKFGALVHATRIAITGRAVSPGSSRRSSSSGGTASSLASRPLRSSSGSAGLPPQLLAFTCSVSMWRTRASMRSCTAASPEPPLADWNASPQTGMSLPPCPVTGCRPSMIFRTISDGNRPPLLRANTVRSGGRTFIMSPSAPSPRPALPWQATQ